MLSQKQKQNKTRIYLLLQTDGSEYHKAKTATSLYWAAALPDVSIGLEKVEGPASGLQADFNW